MSACKLIPCALLLVIAAACEPTLPDVPDPGVGAVDPGTPIAARRFADAQAATHTRGVHVRHDTDGDGATDAVATDLDGDGLADIITVGSDSWHDTDGNGSWDTVLRDLDGDDRHERAETDIDEDRRFDHQWVDDNGDGFVDEEEVRPLSPPIPFVCPAVANGLNAEVDGADADAAIDLLQRGLLQVTDPAGVPEPSDFDGDGVADDTVWFEAGGVIGVDTETDEGRTTMVDVNRDGRWDTEITDRDGDGRGDEGRTDVDNDGRFDHAWSDTNGDGRPQLEEIVRLGTPVVIVCPLAEL
jgi:hypothetical protein